MPTAHSQRPNLGPLGQRPNFLTPPCPAWPWPCSSPSPDSPGCPTGWIKQSGRCYQFSTVEKNWDEAKEYCRSNEAQLVSVGSPEEHDYIFQNINEWVWTGGYYEHGAETWAWSDGTPWNYQYWFYRQPSSQGAGGCRAVQIFSTFAMSPCQNRRKFICEKGATEFSTGNGGLSSLSAGCPTGWKSMFNSCFQWFYTAMKTWQDAENHCQQFGGHLASLSEVENELIGKTILGTVWIGGKKVGSQWTWSDGTPWSLGNVRTAPSPVGGDCSVTFAGRASGFDCNKERLYICRFVLQ